VNITVGEKEERLMMTGMHTVVDIFCVGCGASVGWKYVRSLLHYSFLISFCIFSSISGCHQIPCLFQEAAHEKSQKYKEGKFILERCVNNLWPFMMSSCPPILSLALNSTAQHAFKANSTQSFSREWRPSNMAYVGAPSLIVFPLWKRD